MSLNARLFGIIVDQSITFGAGLTAFVLAKKISTNLKLKGIKDPDEKTLRLIGVFIMLFAVIMVTVGVINNSAPSPKP